MRISRMNWCLAAMLLAGTAFAAPETWLSPTGDDLDDGSELNPYATLAVAVANTDADGVVNVLPGSYTLGAIITRTSGITIRGVGETRPEFTVSGGTVRLQFQADNVTLDNLAFTKADTTTDSTILDVDRKGPFGSYELYQNIVLRNLTLTGGRRAAFIAASGLTIENCVVTGQTRDCFQITSAQGAGAACDCETPVGQRGQGIIIHNNVFEGIAGSRVAIKFENLSSVDPITSGNISIVGNTLKGKTQFFLFNQWLGNPATDKINLTIRGNSIRQTSSNPIIFYVGGLTNDMFGLFESIDIRDNIISGVNKPAVAVDYAAGSDNPVPAPGLFQLASNLVHAMADSAHSSDATGLVGIKGTTSVPAGATIPGIYTVTGTIEADPLWADDTHANNNFEVLAGSPAIGAASNAINVGASQVNGPDPADSDGDGVYDSDELLLGTDPAQRDTDTDGVGDGMEMALCTDPFDGDDPVVGAGPGNLVPDTDNDGLPDIFDPEPSNPDANSDGTKDGYAFMRGCDRFAGVVLGDADDNTNIDNVDAIRVLEHFLGITLLVGDVSHLDVNRDGNLDNVDAVIIFNFFLGNIPYLPFP